ncbi:hypothetical protein PIB30_078071 [Stylosanthes scabra]|uniref:Uncharacterized protein n=1 Tax=Stylosanthes scabra TaxID=79078 RepID=A0ABU6WP19_9FABA|nr:hypothetical protein [Stylosanthes scabra]
MARPCPPYLMGKFPLVVRSRDPDGAPTPPCFVTSKTRTSCARATAAELTKMKAILGISLFRALAHPLLNPNSTYMGGGIAEAQQAFSHFINFSLREPHYQPNSSFITCFVDTCSL